ncbi:MAG: cytidylate kinase family protein [Desulfobacteraceae bacterium]|jgi:cytidylate kinase
MAVITISRQKGSFGNQIAKAVAERLRYNRVGKAEISDALADQGLEALVFEKFDGRRPSIWHSLSQQKKQFIHFLRAAVYDFARRGNVVILGRGGQVLLKGIPATLHVRIVAPFGTRVRRLMEMADFSRRKAENELLLSDHDSSGFIRSYFDINWSDIDMYDLVLNTRTMSVETGVSLIAAAVASREFGESTKAVETNLENMALVEKAKGVLVGFPGISLTGVEVTNGEMVLTGLARSKENIEHCKSAVESISGVKKVRTKLDIVALTGI